MRDQDTFRDWGSYGTRFRTHLLDGFDAASAHLARSKRAAYLWCLWSFLCLLAVITGAGGVESFSVGLIAGAIGVRRLHVLVERDHRADLESWEADTRDADVAWWLDRLRYSNLTQERVAAQALLAHWGVRSHLNPLESEGDRIRRAERIKAEHEAEELRSADRASAMLDRLLDLPAGGASRFVENAH